ncbi:membrane hypothetical protein [Microcystis aeruginosa PCC 9432]|jgi:hypothetical protein|uniref:Uncharacterized protein n=1 Tax=Microcystis aeruginosa PCC 9432 TaxID=1160280 RepID=A0A830RAM1_MICAE|nr:hypothetical protein [Microcystis aeruginosa]TRT93409.1 MAG: hypothetical protein EWV62_19590 [Microcystis aeruginosa Ma_OC_LR_19540900_S633]CCH95027.1 membrane hypothetical protein [Microcystis aeruginosa PCC 9432]
MDVTNLAAFLTSLVITKITEETASKIGGDVASSWISLRGKVRKELEENERASLVLNQIDKNSSEDLSTQNLEIIAETLQEKIVKDPEFAKEAEESRQILTRELETEHPEIAQEYLRRIEKLTARIKGLQEDIDIGTIKQQSINVNVHRGDYLGKDPVILSGNNNIIHFISGNGTTSSFFPSEAYTDRILIQTEQIKGKITQFFTVKESMDELDKIRQPRPILTGYIEQELKVRVPFFIFGDLSLRTLFKNKKSNESTDSTIQSDKSASAEAYFRKIKDIESEIGTDAEQDKILLQSLGGIADEINLSISRLNNSFILALYPASSSKELVANMVSKIGYKELREEAEMHLSVISRLVDKLNNLMQKLNIDGLEEKQKDENTSLKNQSDIVLVKAITERLKKRKDEEVKSAFGLIQDLITEPEDDKKPVDDEDDRKIYVLSDEAQAAVGMMIDIEKRRYLVEGLVRSDRSQRTRTTQLVTLTILLIICLMILGGFIYGPSLTVGVKSLDDLNLPLLNIPWPVVFWSFIGSFAAMIYRFNRQPIHEFGDVVKWTLTRLVQGVVLGSAFYLILVSGLSLLTGVTPAASIDPTPKKITTEVILILSFLVGFSDRFADSVFNTLIERYSKSAESTSSKDASKENSEN